MKLQPPAKLAIVAGLAIISSIATSKLLARVPLRVQAQNPPVGKAWAEPTAQVQAPREGIPPVASGIMRSQVKTAVDVVFIEASGHMFDSRPDWSYVWSVRFVKPDDRDTVLFEKRYDEQRFRMPESKEMDVAFQDAIKPPVPPGDYVVEVTVYEVTPRRGLIGLNDPKVAKGARNLTTEAKVTLRD